jgi:hypothetical protein
MATVKITPLKAPFPWFGEKSRASGLVWERFGNVPNYCEPFFGSGAVLLNRPHDPGIETVNDLDCMVANFWRALAADPDLVAHHADWPVNEADQHARHRWLCSREEFRERMKVDPDFYDPKIAGYWVWGQCIWIGCGWCSVKLPGLSTEGTALSQRLPHLGNGGVGIHRKLPHLGDAGKGIHRKRPHLANAGKGINRLGYRDEAVGAPLLTYMRELHERLRHVRVCCGDWSRILGPTPTVKQGLTGVFLDPPYADEAEREMDLYAEDSGSVAHDVREWAIENGNDPRMRIALCGYDEHEMPGDWECVAWKAHGGYGNQSDGDNANRHKETIWFSPHCLKPGLFGALSDEMETEMSA